MYIVRTGYTPSLLGGGNMLGVFFNHPTPPTNRDELPFALDEIYTLTTDPACCGATGFVVDPLEGPYGAADKIRLQKFDGSSVPFGHQIFEPLAGSTAPRYKMVPREFVRPDGITTYGPYIEGETGWAWGINSYMAEAALALPGSRLMSSNPIQLQGAAANMTVLEINFDDPFVLKEFKIQGQWGGPYLNRVAFIGKLEGWDEAGQQWLELADVTTHTALEFNLSDNTLSTDKYRLYQTANNYYTRSVISYLQFYTDVAPTPTPAQPTWVLLMPLLTTYLDVNTTVREDMPFIIASVEGPTAAGGADLLLNKDTFSVGDVINIASNELLLPIIWDEV